MENQQLPINWEKVRLGDISEIVYGKGLPTKKLKPDGFPVFGANGIIGFFETYMYDSSQLLMSCRGANSGAINMSPEKCFVTNNSLIVGFPVEQKILRKTYYYFLQAARKEGLITGTAQPQVTINNAVEVKLPLPPLDEQRRIVAKIEELFSELDKGIESLKAAQNQLKVYRQAVLKHAFEGKLTEQWREENEDRLETAEQFLACIKRERDARYQQQFEDWSAAVKAWEAKGKPGKTPSRPKRPNSLANISAQEEKTLAKLPKGWAHTRLGEIIDEPKYGTSKKCDYDIDGIGVLRIPNVAHGIVDAADLKFAHFDDDEIEAYKLKSGDILTIRSNGSVSLVGKCALISKSEEHYLFAGYLIRLRPNHQLIAPEYLISVLSGHSLRMQIEGKAKSTSGVNNINSGEIQHLIVPVCAIAEQKELMKDLASTLSSIDATESEIDEQIQRSESLRQSILKNAFSGQLVEQDPTDEPAAVLLERIKAEKAAQTTSNKKNKKRKAAA